MRRLFVILSVVLLTAVFFVGAVVEADAYSSREHGEKIERLRKEYNEVYKSDPKRGQELKQEINREFKEKERQYQEYQRERTKRLIQERGR